jgi:hypothetical protein
MQIQLLIPKLKWIQIWLTFRIMTKIPIVLHASIIIDDRFSCVKTQDRKITTPIVSKDLINYVQIQ